MSSRLTVTRPAWFAAAIASRAICSAISVKTSFNAFTADKETRSAPAFLAMRSKGAEGKDPDMIFKFSFDQTSQKVCLILLEKHDLYN